MYSVSDRSSSNTFNMNKSNKDIKNKNIYDLKSKNNINRYNENYKMQKKFEMTQWKNNSNEQNAIRPVISPHLRNLGVNLVGLNTNNIQGEDEFDNIRMSYSGNKLTNLRLEGIGVSSPTSQKIARKKIRLQGISNEAPLKISAAFGRTAYTFIEQNNNKKNNLFQNQFRKKNKSVEKNNLDIYFAPNNK